MWTNRNPVALSVALAGLMAVGCESGVEQEAEVQAPPTAAPVTEAPGPTSLVDIFPEGLGRSLVIGSCGSCHAAACSAIGQRTAERWSALEADHRDRVADMTDADYQVLFEYLAANFNDSKPQPNIPPQFLEGGCTPF